MPNPLQAPTKPTKYGTLLVTAVVMLIIGFAAGAAIYGPRQWKSGHAAGYSDANKELSAKLDKSGLLPPVPQTMSLTGTVTAVNGDSLTMTVPQMNRNPLANDAPTTRTVTLADGGKVVLSKSLSPDEYTAANRHYQDEQKAFMEAMAAGKTATPPAPPAPFTQSPAKFSDIKVGMQVTVQSKSDIAFAASIAADSLSIQNLEVATPPAPPAPPAGGPNTP